MIYLNEYYNFFTETNLFLTLLSVDAIKVAINGSRFCPRSLRSEIGTDLRKSRPNVLSSATKSPGHARKANSRSEPLRAGFDNNF